MTLTDDDRRVIELEDARLALRYAELQQAAAPRDEARKRAVFDARRRVVAAMAANLEARG